MLSHQTRRAVLAAAALLLLAGLPALAEGPESPVPQGTPATVSVHNYNTLDVEVYAVTESGRRFRLGAVNRISQRALALPDQLTDGTTEFRLKIYSFRPREAASAYRRYLQGVKTNPLSAKAGELIPLIVTDPLVNSYVNY